MTAPKATSVQAALRNSVFLLGVLVLPGLSGCVSALDDSAAFGFGPAEQQSADAAPADTPAAEGAATETAALADGASAEAASGQTAELSTPASHVQTGEAAEAGLSEAASTYAAPSPNTLAAYSTPRKQAESSLYASLMQRAEREQPEVEEVPEASTRVVVTQTDGMGKPNPSAELPGVDPSSLFKIGRRASMDSEELLDDIGGSYQLASLGGMARLAPSGLMVARDDVNTSCFGSELVRLLRQIEARFGKKVVVTSGYRSPSHNRRVRGAKASLHMACKAADLHIPGVSGLEVARYVRSLPNRGGVGTYCHTAAIHVDVGRTRDWNWPCRRRG